ncbi:MAG: leucine-rich repeat domain-containing protein, partial [Clostridiales bacterium]|nr:leucine-rich repeat domain-containing protein [Clostridiales bacterium]
IGYHAFMVRSSLVEIDVPDNVTELDSEVFRNCTSLKKAKIGEVITIVETGLFNGCYSLGEVTFDGEITEIKSMAFANCLSLLSFTIPASVTKLEDKAFQNALRLVEVYNLSALKPNVWTGLNDNTVMHTDLSEPSIIDRRADGFTFCTCKDLIYPRDEGPFLLDYTGSAEKLVLPADYEGNNYKIFRYALAFNPQLKSVTISAGVEAIRDEILFGCNRVGILTVDSENAYYTSKNNCVISVADSKFVLGCRMSVIPNDGSVTTIGSNVFCHNPDILQSLVKIPASVTRVERCAFDGCTGIMRTAENHVVYVDKWAYAFDYDDRKNPLDLELEAGTVGICDFAFSTLAYANSNMSTGAFTGYSIGSVKFNAELKYVGDSAFYGCSNMKAITFNDGLLRIDSSAFDQCTKLEEIVIPDSVQEIGTSAFSYCSALEYVKLPEGLKEIKHNMFNRCTSLKAIVIPSGVNKVTYWAFKDTSTTFVVYYGGSSSDDWKGISVDSDSNTAFKNATRYYYSETAQEGDYWHYGDDGKPTTEY